MYLHILVGGCKQPLWPNTPSSGSAVLSECGQTCFTEAMDGVFPQTFASTLPGDKMNVVCRLQCWDSAHDAHLLTAVNDGVKFLATGLIDGANATYTFMNATLKQMYPIPILAINEDTKVFKHEPPSWDAIHAVVELCAGFGGMTQGISACGFHTVAAVDFIDRMSQLHAKQGEIETITGDVTDPATVCKIWHHAKGAGTIAAGFACQPFSRLGDQKGGDDSRAQSLRGILQTAFFLQVQVVILECVAPAASNQFVQDEIRHFFHQPS